MTVVNKVTFTNVSSAIGVLDKIRTTAVSWGWAQNEWRDGYIFDATGDQWAVDVNGGYLCLTSTGQGGSQNLIAKLAVDKAYADATRYDMMASMCTSTSYSLTSSSFPVYQNTAGLPNSPVARNQYGWSLPSGNISQIWIMGNAQYICVVANCDGVLYQIMEFGSYEMRDPTPTVQNGSISDWTVVGSTSGEWSDYVNYTPQGVAVINNVPSVTKSGNSNEPYWFNDGIPYNNWYQTVKRNVGLGGSNYKSFTPNYDLCFSTGDNSGRRFMMKNTILYIRSSDGLIVPVSETFASLLNGLGLQPAQSLFYGTDEYIIFPCCSILSEAWIAFRIV